MQIGARSKVFLRVVCMAVDGFAILGPALVLAMTLRAVMTALENSSRCAKRRYLVSNGRDEKGRLLWKRVASDSDEDDAASPATVANDTGLFLAPLAQLANSVHAVPLQQAEFRVVATVAAARALNTYIRMLDKQVVLTSDTWFLKADSGEMHLAIDPDGVLAAIATLARRIAGVAAHTIAMNNADEIDDVARAAVGVGHKLTARLETLHVSGSMGLAYEINMAMGGAWATPEQCDRQQIALEFDAVRFGFAFSCCAHNLSAGFCDREAATRPATRSALEGALLCSVARVFHLALCVNSESDALEAVLLRAAPDAAERAFEAIVLRATLGPPKPPETLGAAARAAAKTLLRGIAPYSEHAFSIVLPPGTSARLGERVQGLTTRCACERILSEF